MMAKKVVALTSSDIYIIMTIYSKNKIIFDKVGVTCTTEHLISIARVSTRLVFLLLAS